MDTRFRHLAVDLAIWKEWYRDCEEESGDVSGDWRVHEEGSRESWSGDGMRRIKARNSTTIDISPIDICICLLSCNSETRRWRD
jgi:hypothetical protein